MQFAEKIRGQSWRRYLGREPVVLVWLSILAILLFFAVALLSKTYTAQSQARASQWYSQGIADLQAGRTERAADDFRVALSYWRDNYGYEVSLAESLLALNRTEEAKAYLTTLWQLQPENGTVNLELARLYAKAGEVNDALRFYHNAIYAIWESNPETQQRSARIELTEFLLDRKSLAQAESELIVLSGNLHADASLHAKVGDLFMKVPDYARALVQYQESLRLKPRAAEVTAHAGRAAFEVARYSLAIHYLELALASNPRDIASAGLLQTAKMVREMDPNSVPATKFIPVVLQDFRDAGHRLAACIAQVGAGSSSSTALPQLNSSWTVMDRGLTARRLDKDPELADSALDLVFNIETKTNDVCGQPSGADLALLLIAQQREGN